MDDVVFNEALDYMSFEEWIDLCGRIINAYNTVKGTEEKEN